MVTVGEAAFLGILQGLTEFLPISSSGHLAVAQSFLEGFEQPGILFDVMLHLGTLLSILVYFRRDLIKLIHALRNPGLRLERRLLLFIVLGSIPTGIIGYAFRDLVEESFRSIPVVSAFLMTTGAILIISDRLGRGERPLEGMGPVDALFIGVGQGLAVLPGLSRSGTTIASGLIRGLDRELSARFSFLLAIPAIAGAGLVEVREVGGPAPGELGPYIIGTALAAVVGLISIKWVLLSVKKRRFGYFGIYCLIIGAVLMVRGLEGTL